MAQGKKLGESYYIILRRSAGPGQVLRKIIPFAVSAAAELVPWPFQPYGWIIEKI